MFRCRQREAVLRRRRCSVGPRHPQAWAARRRRRGSASRPWAARASEDPCPRGLRPQGLELAARPTRPGWAWAAPCPLERPSADRPPRRPRSRDRARRTRLQRAVRRAEAARRGRPPQACSAVEARGARAPERPLRRERGDRPRRTEPVARVGPRRAEREARDGRVPPPGGRCRRIRLRRAPPRRGSRSPRRRREAVEAQRAPRAAAPERAAQAPPADRRREPREEPMLQRPAPVDSRGGWCRTWGTAS